MIALLRLIRSWRARLQGAHFGADLHCQTTVYPHYHSHSHSHNIN